MGRDGKQCRVAKTVIRRLKKEQATQTIFVLKSHSRPHLTDAARILTRAQSEEMGREES